jgi:hypothetical protein
MSNFFSPEEQVDAALRRFHQREAGYASTPRGYEEILRADEDEQVEAGDYEMRQRALGARAILLWIVSEGLHPKKLVRRLLVVGRACATEPFNLLTMEEAAMLGDEQKATHSARCKVLSRMMQRLGMKGFKIAGQKPESATAKYSASAKGNRNRANSVKKAKI